MFCAGVFGAAEEGKQIVLGAGAGFADYGEGFGLEEAGEVEEVGVLTVGVENGAGAVFEVGGGEESHAVGGEGEG